MCGKYKKTRRTYLKLAGMSAVALGSTGTAVAATDDVAVPDDYDTIQAAVDAVPPGGTVRVDQGTYHGVVHISKPVTLLGDPGNGTPGPGPNAPVLDGEGKTETTAFNLYDETGPDNVTIQGFEIHNYGARPVSGEWGKGVSAGVNSDQITISDCHIHDVGASGISVSGNGQQSHRDWTVERNVIEGAPESAVRFDHVSDSVIRNNVIRGGAVTDDGSWEANRKDTDPDKGIELHANTREGFSSVQEKVTIENNVIEGQYETAGVYLLAINKNDPDAHPDTLAKIRRITISNNEIKGTAPGHGVALAVNPVQGAPTRMRGITIRDNRIQNGQLGIHCGSGATNGLAGVKITDNAITDSAIGVTAGTSANEGYRNIQVTDCDLQENTVGVLTWGNVVDDSLVIRQSNINGNEEYAAINGSGGRVDARRNYWGAPNGPERDAGPVARASPADSIKEVRDRQKNLPTIGHGNAILEQSEEIFVTPWLSKPV